MEEKLINLVQGYDYLYNMSSAHYMNTQLKNNAWNKIGTEMNKTGEECQKIWNNIRSNFRKALINRKSKSGNPNKKRRPIKYEKELEFLKKFIHQRKRTSDFSSEDTQTSFALQFAGDGNQECAIPRMTNDSQHSLIKVVEPTTTAEILNTYIETKKEMDAIDSFFQTMAATTKKLPEIVQNQIKRKIFNIVNDAEFNYIEENEIRLVSAPTQASTSEDESTDLRYQRPYRTKHSTASTSGSASSIIKME